MKKISFDYSSLENNVMPSIDASITNLSSANSLLNSLRIPSDFPHINQVRSLNENIVNVLNKQKQIKNELVDLNNKVNRVLNTTSVNVSRIQIIEIKK